MPIDTDELELPVFTSDKQSKITRCNNGEWINQSNKPKKTIKCYVSATIVERVRDIQHSVDRKFGSSNEFGGFVKWHWDEDGDIIVDDFMIPQQVVGGATVDFRSPPTPGYTGVFHKHPDGCCGFSGVDDTYINSNNDLSILFVNGTFRTGIVNIDIPDSNARFQTTVTIVIGNKNRNEVDVSMVLAASNFRGNIAVGRRGFQEQVKIPSQSLPSIGTGAPALVDIDDIPDEDDDSVIDDDNDDGLVIP